MIRLIGLRVTIYMRSGRTLSFLCDELEKRFEGNELVSLTGRGSKGWPFYFRLNDVEAITDRRVLWLRWQS